MKSCPECGSRKISWSNGEIICNKCGSVIGESFVSGKRIVV
jgi:transcription initiation factor TFIIIB Brf1 subunit/transcription initiation factor TFIIB